MKFWAVKCLKLNFDELNFKMGETLEYQSAIKPSIFGSNHVHRVPFWDSGIMFVGPVGSRGGAEA